MVLKKATAVMLCIFTIFTLSACGEGLVIKPYSVPDGISVTDSAVVAENGQYLLEWDAEAACVLLKSKADGTVWSTVPYGYYTAGEQSASINSPIYIQYYNPSDGGLESAKAYSDCISDGLMSAETTDNGLKLSFYFIDAEITVPLYFELREDSLYTYVPADEIIESGKTRLIELSVLPYLCSAVNTDSKDTYLMIPSGSGALVYTDEEVTGVSRVYSGEVYGTDAGRKLLDNTFESEVIRIPAYGVKNGETALLSLIEEGSGSARIDVDAGNFRNGYSTAYTTFQVRSYDEIEATRNEYSDERIYSAGFDSAVTYGIGFYPLSGDKADYVGMAETVRKQYEIDGTKKTAQADYALNILGGAVTKHFIMGIPYNALTVSTTFDDALEIIGELTDSTASLPAVTLSGFGESGISAGKIAGGYTFASALGGEKGHREIEEYCKEKGISLFTDFDVIQFGKSGNGFGTSFDCAKTASHQKAYNYPLTRHLRFPDDTQKKIYLLNRADIKTALEKLSEKSDGISGISLSSLGSTAYSDYSDISYASKGNTEEITALLTELSGKEHKVSVSGANSYAARAASVISDVPVQRGGNLTLDENIPFYQLVFGKAAALYTEPLNLATDREGMLLRAVEMGVSPTFSVCKAYENDLDELAENVFYTSVYEGVKDTIQNCAEKTSEYFRAISESYIVSHAVLGDGVTETVFANGVRVTVNHSGQTVQTGGQAIAPYDFSFTVGKGATE